MRQIKKFMEAKRPMWNCNECKCITMQCWKESEAFCGCGESKISLSNKFVVASNTEELYSVYFFNEDVEQNNTISVETDPESETGEMRVVVGDFLAIEDEEARALWLGTWESLDAEAIETLLGRYDEGNTGVGHFIPEAMTQFNALINNPTEDSAAGLKQWLESKASDGQLIVVFD